MPKKFSSISTVGHRMTLRNILSELVMMRKYHGRLPAYFWRDSRWKFAYGKEVQAISKFIRQYGEQVVAVVIRDNYISTARNYGNLEFLLQSKMDSIARELKVKDTSIVINEKEVEVKDLRDYDSKKQKRKGLFERLNEIEKNRRD